MTLARVQQTNPDTLAGVFGERLRTRILDPLPTDPVYDPSCGAGGMLVGAANEVVEAGGSVPQIPSEGGVFDRAYAYIREHY